MQVAGKFQSANIRDKRGFFQMKVMLEKYYNGINKFTGMICGNVYQDKIEIRCTI